MDECNLEAEEPLPRFLVDQICACDREALSSERTLSTS